jgi:hypothetical protein
MKAKNGNQECLSSERFSTLTSRQFLSDHCLTVRGSENRAQTELARRNLVFARVRFKNIMEGSLEENRSFVIDAQTIRSFRRLSIGFMLSIVSTVLFVAVSLELWTLILMAPLAIVYIAGMYMRGSGWRLIGFSTTQRAVEVSAILIVLFPFWQTFFARAQLFRFGRFQGLIFLIPLALWTFYTCLENLSFRELEKKFALKLISARILSALGIISYALAYGYGVFIHNPGIFDSLYSMMVFPFIYGVFAAPFLILCSLILIVKLGDARMPAPKMVKNGSKRADLHYWVFGVVILLLVILLGLLLFFPMQRIGLGDEIKGFPAKETSLTVWNWTTTLTVNVTGIAQANPQYQQYVVLNVSLRNIASHEVYFGTNDSFNQELQQAKTRNLFLEYFYDLPKYGRMTEIAHSETNALDIGWGITPTEKLSSLAPNQSVNGSIYFIIHQVWTPKNLFCNDTNGRLFTVALNN